MEFITRLNWIDILIVAIAVRIVYTSMKSGFMTEFMKTLGTFVAVVVVLQYYMAWTALLGRVVHAPEALLQTGVFAGAWLILTIAFNLFASGFMAVFTVQAVSAVDKWGAAVISIGRFFMTGSLLLFAFLLTDLPYMERLTHASWSQKHVLLAAPKVYEKTMNGFVMKFFPDMKINPAVNEELQEIVKK